MDLVIQGWKHSREKALIAWVGRLRIDELAATVIAIKSLISRGFLLMLSVKV